MVISGVVEMCGIGCACIGLQSNVLSNGMPAVMDELLALFGKVCVAPTDV